MITKKQKRRPQEAILSKEDVLLRLTLPQVLDVFLSQLIFRQLALGQILSRVLA